MADISLLNNHQNYSWATVILQTPSSNYEERLSSLRFLKFYVEDEKSLNTSDKHKINQLIMDNIMQIIMNPDTTDIRNGHIIRTECFLILSSLLNSSTLFGDIKTSSKDIDSSDVSPPSSSEDTNKRRSSETEPGDDGNNIIRYNTMSQQNNDRNQLSKYYENDKDGDSQQMLRRFSDSDSKYLIAQNDHVPKDLSKTRVSTSHNKGDTKTSDLTLLKPIINKRVIREILKERKRKERPSIFYDSKYEKDNFVPGTDPTDWFEQVSLIYEYVVC
jgi:hypothetical protein